MGYDDKTERKIIGCVVVVALILIFIMAFVPKTFKDKRVKDLTLLSIDLSQEVLNLYKGDIDLTRFEGKITDNCKNDINAFKDSLTKLDDEVLNLSEYWDNYTMFVETEEGIIRDYAKNYNYTSGDNDENVFLNNGEYFIKLSDLKLSDNLLAVVKFNGVNMEVTLDEPYESYEDIKRNHIYTYKYVNYKYDENTNKISILFKSLYDSDNKVKVTCNFKGKCIDSINISNTSI